jgi:hypothetical protein
LALKKSYSRYFIILQEDEKGYSFSSDKVASGYAKLEMKNDKCKVSYYVQNLKREMAPYYMILVCNKKEVKKIIKIGEMNIDDYGRADVFYEYPIDNVAGSGISMDKVSGAAIVKLLNNNVISVMSGFASTEIPEWKSFVMVEDKNRDKIAEKDETLNSKNIFDKYEENIEELKKKESSSKEEETLESKDETKIDNLHVVEKQEVREKNYNFNKCNIEISDETDKRNENVEDKSEEYVENKREEYKDIEFKVIEEIKQEVKEEAREKPKGEVKEEIKEEVCNQKCSYINTEEYDKLQAEVKIEVKLSDEDEFGDYPRGDTGKFFKSLTNEFEEISDLCTSIKRCKWYKVPINNIQEMYNSYDYNKYAMIYYPMASYYSYIKSFGHYLIGYKCDKKGKVKYLVYGIPGMKDKAYQPLEGKSGFVTWIPVENNSKEIDGFGYWLMFYDFKTSTIVIPVKK